MSRLRPCIAALTLAATACTIPPVAFLDGLPAATPAPGDAAARIQYNRGWWFRDGETEPMQYFTGGLRFGQDWQRFCFEEGLTVLNPGVVLPCLQGGIGLREPAVTLRALWTPVAIGGSVEWDPLMWWQLSLLAGTPRKERGLGISAGARTSRFGMGPVLSLDYTHSGISLRLETSYNIPTPWQDSTVTGQVLSVGITAEPFKSLATLSRQ